MINSKHYTFLERSETVNLRTSLGPPGFLPCILDVYRAETWGTPPPLEYKHEYKMYVDCRNTFLIITEVTGRKSVHVHLGY